MYSQQRRRERYRIIYVWKLLEGLVPEISSGGNGGMKKLHSDRIGRICYIPLIPRTVPTEVRRLREASLQHHRFLLFNALPKEICEITNCSVDSFKNQLDLFLGKIIDEPLVKGYTALRRTVNNSLVHMIPFARQNTVDKPLNPRSAPVLRQ